MLNNFLYVKLCYPNIVNKHANYYLLQMQVKDTKQSYEVCSFESAWPLLP